MSTKNTTAEKPAAKITERKTAKGHTLTKSWKSKNGRELNKGDKVKCGTVTGTVDWRFTKDVNGKRIPMIGILTDGTTVNGRNTKHASFPASEVIHVGAAPRAKGGKKVPESPEVKAEGKKRNPEADAAAAKMMTTVQRATAAADAVA
jgi:hypothetical protein